jgi:hypothetical protein
VGKDAPIDHDRGVDFERDDGGVRAPSPSRAPEWRPPEEHAAHTLQHLVGNRGVASLVQRQADPSGSATPLDDEPLDPAQVTDALRYYRVQPWLYTAAVVRDIRTAVGLDADGGITAEMVQAVARFQRDEGSSDPALVVDGKAGPRTMPRVFPSGLNAAGEGEQFAEDAQAGVLDEWDNLGDAQTRATALVQRVNERLVAAGVPAVTVVVYDGDSPRESGSFDFSTWTMQLNRLRLELGGLSQNDAAQLVDTVYHEARHTEQWFRMAQLRAGQGLSAAGITAELQVPRRIAAAARADPIRSGTPEAVIAQGWWDSVYGHRAEHRERVLTDITEADWAVTEARCRCNNAPTAENQARLDAAIAHRSEMHDRYRDLPEENDAWATGPMAGGAVTRGTSNPEAVPAEDPCERLRRAGRPVPPAVAPALDDVSGGAGVEPSTDTGVDEPAGTAPTIDGPLHGVLPEENLP